MRRPLWRAVCTVLTTLAATLAVVTAGQTPAQAADGVDDTTFKITPAFTANGNNTRCLDAVTTVDVLLTNSCRNSGGGMLWTLRRATSIPSAYRLIPPWTGRCLESDIDTGEVWGGNCSSGTDAKEIWVMERLGSAGVIRFKPAADVNRCLKSDGTNVTVAKCSLILPAANTMWLMAPEVVSGQVRSAPTGKCWEVSAPIGRRGRPILQQTCDSATGQRFTLRVGAVAGNLPRAVNPNNVVPGRYSLRTHNDLCVGPHNGMSPGSRVLQTDCPASGGDPAVWQVIPEPGYTDFRIHLATDPSLVIELSAPRSGPSAGKATDDGRSILFARLDTGWQYQRWEFVR